MSLLAKALPLSATITKGGPKIENTCVINASGRAVLGHPSDHFTASRNMSDPVSMWRLVCLCVWVRRSLRPPRCVSAGPVVVRLAEMAI